MEEIRVMIGQTIATRRKALGLTQKQLAEKLGISNRAVSKWENLEANPDIGLLVPLSEILQTTTDNLLRGTETEDTITENKNYSKKGERRVSAKTKIGYICVTGFLGVTMLAACVSFIIAVTAIPAFDGKNTGSRAVVITLSLLFMITATVSYFLNKKRKIMKKKMTVASAEKAQALGYRIFEDIDSSERKELKKDYSKSQRVPQILILCAVVIILISGLAYAFLSNKTGNALFLLCMPLIIISVAVSAKKRDEWCRKNMIVFSEKQIDRL